MQSEPNSCAQSYDDVAGGGRIGERWANTKKDDTMEVVRRLSRGSEGTLRTPCGGSEKVLILP